MITIMVPMGQRSRSRLVWPVPRRTAMKYGNASRSAHPSASLAYRLTTHDASGNVVATSSHRRGHWAGPVSPQQSEPCSRPRSRSLGEDLLCVWPPPAGDGAGLRPDCGESETIPGRHGPDDHSFGSDGHPAGSHAVRVQQRSTATLPIGSSPTDHRKPPKLGHHEFTPNRSLSRPAVAHAVRVSLGGRLSTTRRGTALISSWSGAGSAVSGLTPPGPAKCRSGTRG